MARFDESDSPEQTVSRLLARVDRWAKGQLPDRPELEQLRWDLDLLEYQLQPRLSWAFSNTSRRTANPVCAVPACKATWQQGLINQAGPWHDPVWYCAEHEPSYRANGVSAPPGSPVPAGPQLAKAREMADRWGKFLARIETSAEAEAETAAKKEPTT